MYKRKLNLIKLLSRKKSAFLFGPRAVGKTVLAQEYLGSVRYKQIIDLLNLDIYRRYVSRPELFRLEVKQRLGELPKKEILTVLVDEGTETT